MFVLDVSNNKLTGKIPVGGQMETMNDPNFFANNGLLCGMHIRVPCLEELSQTKPLKDENKEKWLLWEGVVIGFSFGFIIAVGILYHTWSNQTILDLDFSAFDHLFATNVRGMAACVKHAANAMIKGHVRGSIVCTATVAASCGDKKHIDYFISRHAVLGLVRSASQQLGEHGIRVNCVSPYVVATPLMAYHALGMDAEQVGKLFEERLVF
nr:short-chain dehydrogenase reductase 5 [Quercus suber]